jgi:hypothetical protein
MCHGVFLFVAAIVEALSAGRKDGRLSQQARWMMGAI